MSNVYYTCQTHGGKHRPAVSWANDRGNYIRFKQANTIAYKII